MPSGRQEISIKINMLLLQHYTNDQEFVEVKGNTVIECLAGLVQQYPKLKQILFAENGKLNSDFGIAINGVVSHLEELANPVKDGDELHVIFHFGGG